LQQVNEIKAKAKADTIKTQSQLNEHEKTINEHEKTKIEH